MAVRTKVFVDIKTTSDGKEPGAGLKKFAIGAGIAAVAVAGLIKIGKDLVNVYSVQEQAEARLEQTIKSTGEAAGLTFDQLTDMATGLQEVTKFGDEAIIGAESLLLTFKDIGEDVFPRALESILDVSEAMGTGLKESSIQVGKALNDPIQGLTALRRVGIQFSDAQEELIKGFVKNNDLASAQGIILTELESQFGGVARAAADTATGSMTQFANVIGDLQEELGQTIAEGLQPFVIESTNVVTALVSMIKEGREFKNILKSIREGGDVSGASLEELTNTLARLNAEQAAGSALGVNKRIKEEIAAVEGLIAAYGVQDTFLIKINESRLAGIRAGDDQAASEKVVADLAIAAGEKLEELRIANLSGTEREIELLQNQINVWAEYRDTVEGAEELFQELAEQRNELLEEESDIFEDVNQTAMDFYTNEDEASHQMVDNVMVEIDAVNELNETFLNLAETGIGAFAQAFKDVGEGNITLWKGFKEAGKDSISALLESLGQMAIVQAAISAAGFNFVSAVGYTAAAAAAFAASGLVQSFATGGEFITDGPTTIGNNLVGDNASGQERVTVTPLGGGGASNNTGQVMILRIGDRDIKAVVQGWIDNRGLHSSQGGAI